jgi:hypothetical protein
MIARDKSSSLLRKSVNYGRNKSDLVAQQSVTPTISLTIMNLATPKAGAKHELWGHML